MKVFIDHHRQQLGVESICRALQVAPSAYWRHAARQRSPALRSTRAQRDAQLLPQVQRVWQANMQVYGAKKVWRQFNRGGGAVARCIGKRLMRQVRRQGVRRGKATRTIIRDPKAPCPLDSVNRQFLAERPNQLWVSDFTYVSTWQGKATWPSSSTCSFGASWAGSRAVRYTPSSARRAGAGVV